jgi:hypothetical protein
LESAVFSRLEGGVILDPLKEDALPAVCGHKPTLEQILRLEREMRARPEICVELEPNHHFAPGLYARELFIPAGTVLTGKTHRNEHFNICIGDITVWTEDGMKRLSGYHRLVSSPGTKRVGYTHEDTVWITFHHNPTNTHDLKQIEAEHIMPELIGCPEEHLCLG